MAAEREPEVVDAHDRAQWRAWLARNHASASGAWLVMYKKAAAPEGGPPPGVSYEEAVEEALSFGWIDSRPNRVDARRYKLLFSPRKPGSVWAASNKARVERLVEQGLMTPAGLAPIEAAKRDRSWNTLDEVDALMVPEDLQRALDANEAAKRNFDAFSVSSRRIILYRIASAKRPETRATRIDETVRLAADNIRAAGWRPREK